MYDNANRLSAQHWEIQGDSYSESYTYDTGDGSLESMTTAGGQTLSYTYDFLKRHSATTVKNGSSTIFTVSKSYYDQTADTTLTTAQVQYYNVHNSAGTLIAGSQYVYDARGNITQIKESESPYRVLAEYAYDELNQLVSETTYTYNGTSTTASSTTVNTFTYDTAGNLLSVSENGTVKDTYTYGNADWVDLLTKFNGETITYDASGNPLNWYNGNTYTDLNWVMGRQLESLTVQKETEELDISYSYDMSGIRSSKTIVIREVEAHTHEYTSAVTAPTCTTAGYTTYTCECGESYVDNLVDALGHNYVASGNVYTCSRCGDSYTGHEHSYTESTTDPTCTEAGYTLYTCSCGDSYTVDLPALGHDYVLVNQSGTTGTYQCSRCGHTYSATIPVTPPTEEYSLRSSNATVEYREYVYASGKLMREIITTTSGTTTTTEVLDFVYGSGSAPLALVYTNGTASPVTYYYVTNIQGDVVKMVNASGAVVAEYAYDAWGKVLSAEGDMAEVNPIRYRGYYYDSETGFYYLQSRYYDPEVRKFVNADGIASTGQGFLGQNMFAYCNNNPVNAYDPSGYAASWTNQVAICDGGSAQYAVIYGSDEDTLRDLYDYLCEYGGVPQDNSIHSSVTITINSTGEIEWYNEKVTFKDVVSVGCAVVGVGASLATLNPIPAKVIGVATAVLPFFIPDKFQPPEANYPTYVVTCEMVYTAPVAGNQYEYSVFTTTTVTTYYWCVVGTSSYAYQKESSVSTEERRVAINLP